jgi:hypothetical protein
MNCGQCQKPLRVGSDLHIESQSVSFRTANGLDIRVHFCSLQCVWWGGQKYARSANPGAPTTKRTFKALYPGAVE